MIKAIGKGRFSVGYRARRRGGDPDKLVALKKVALADDMDEKARNKVLKEVRLLQRLDHPNIIAYLDAFIDAKELVIVFEWAEAGDLKRQVRKARERDARFDERVIWKYFVQICAAIEHMHTNRVMHRDLKPANMLLLGSKSEIPHLLLADFGIADIFGGPREILPSEKKGTWPYMAPEIFNDEVSPKSDVWALGVVTSK